MMNLSNYMKRYFVSFILFTILFECCCFSSTKKSLVMGYEEFKPFLYRDSAGNFAGVDYDIVFASMITADLQVKPYKNEVPWKRQLAWIKSGDLDFIMGASKNKEREKYAYFSDPYRSESVSLFVRKGESENYEISSLKDILKIPNFKLGVFRGSYYGEGFEELKSNSEFVKRLHIVSSDLQNMKLLLNNRVDGILLDSVAGIAFLENEGMLNNYIEVHPMPVILTGEIYVMFSKKTISKEIVGSFNYGLSQIKSSGVYDKIINKYLSESK